MYEPLYKRFRILEVGIFPRGAIQPEGPTGGVGQDHVVSIAEIARGQEWHEGAQLEADGKPLAMGRTVRHRCFRFRSANVERCFALVVGDDHLPMTGGNRVKGAGMLTVAAPNPFDEPRV